MSSQQCAIYCCFNFSVSRQFGRQGIHNTVVKKRLNFSASTFPPGIFVFLLMQPRRVLNGHVFSTVANNILQHAHGLTVMTSERRFRSLFGINADMCAIAWNYSIPRLPRNAEPMHLLWALMFLKVYASETVHSRLARCDEKTFRKWSWLFIKLLSDLSIVR